MNEEKLALGAALLKRGKYKSASQYLHTVKIQHLKIGFAWHENWETLMGDLRRSCRRGLGATRRAAALPKPSATVRYMSKTVQGVADSITVGFAWMRREIELAVLTVADAMFQKDEGCGRA